MPRSGKTEWRLRLTMTRFAVAFGVVAAVLCSSVGAAPSPMKNSRPGRDEEGGAGGGGGGGGGGIFPGLDQWTNLLPGGTLPAGVTMPDIGAAASAVSGIVTVPPNLPTAIPPAIPTNLPPGFPTGIPNINDIISSLPGINP